MATSQKHAVVATHMLSDADFERIGKQRKNGRKVMHDAKVRARGDLDVDEWSRSGWAFTQAAVASPKERGFIAREDAATLSVDDFRAKYEVPNLPVIIRGCCERWPAFNGAWHPHALMKTYKRRRFKCGEDDDGYPVKVELKYFLRYLVSHRDDSPLYVFDSMYNEDRSSCGILHDYEVPPYFTDDLFRLVGEHRRPPYRWFLVGPARSGTGVHTDPLGTSAWNSLIYGRKRWVLFPPGLAREVVKAKAYVRPGEDDEPVDYFATILSRIRAAGGPSLVEQMIEFVQYPGDTVFVPGGWWHAVLNLDHTVAITQNFCSRVNFDRVWVEARDGRHGMARKWLRQLRVTHPDLAARADAINAQHGWSMEAEAARHAERMRLAAVAKAARRTAKERGDDSDASSTSSDSSSSSGSSGSVTSASSCAARAPARVSTSTADVDVSSASAPASSSDDEIVITRAIKKGGSSRKKSRMQ